MYMAPVNLEESFPFSNCILICLKFKELEQTSVFVAKLPEPKPVVARPIQVGGASNSRGSTERQPRTIEVDPRAPYRTFPDDQRVQYGANPARVNTSTHLDTRGMRTIRKLQLLVGLEDSGLQVRTSIKTFKLEHLGSYENQVGLNFRLVSPQTQI